MRQHDQNSPIRRRNQKKSVKIIPSNTFLWYLKIRLTHEESMKKKSAKKKEAAAGKKEVRSVKHEMAEAKGMKKAMSKKGCM